MLDRNENEIIISDELQEVIDNIKELPKDKLKEGLSLLSYSFPMNIIYFGYLNNCYDLKGMKKIDEFFSCYRHFHFKNREDHLNLFNNILDKMDLTEKVYNEHKDYIKYTKKWMLDEMLDKYIENKSKYSFEDRNSFANISYFFNEFVLYEVMEYINDKNYYYVTLNFKQNSHNDTPYQILDYYIYKKYKSEYENTDNENLLIFEKLYTSVLKDYKYSIEISEENQIFVFLGDIRKEEIDVLEYVSDDEEEKIIFFGNNIGIMLELANKLSEYFIDNEAEFRSVLDE